MSNVSRIFAARWMLAALIISTGVTSEAVLCISSGHAAVEVSACRAPGAARSTTSQAVAPVQVSQDDGCGPCQDIPLDGEVLGRTSTQLDVDQLVDLVPAVSWPAVANCAATPNAVAFVHQATQLDPHVQQSVILLI